MEKTKICAACLIEQPLKEYWTTRDNPDGLNRRCRTCVNARIKIPVDRMLKKVTEQTVKDRLKRDYDTAYGLLEVIGYDMTKDLHQQFLDRHNQNTKVPMTYQKKRKSEMPAFYSDGTYNEEYKYRGKLLDD
jgi:hypothetical protein